MSLELLAKIENVEFLAGTDLSRFTTIKLKARGDLAIVSSLDALKKTLLVLAKEDRSYHVLGWGSNQVLANTKDALFIKLKLPFDRSTLSEVRDKYELPASAPLNVLQSRAQKLGLKGWEVFTGVPASLGGAIYMNAGTALGEIGEIVESVTLMDARGELRVVSIGPGSFSYRANHFVKEGEIIVSAVLNHKGVDPSVSDTIKDYMDYRKRTQPLKSFNCGCVWKNKTPDHRAGLFIDKSRLGNLSVGALEVSGKHANFYENKGGADYADFEQLTELLREQLLLHTGIRFELEAKVY